MTSNSHMLTKEKGGTAQQGRAQSPQYLSEVRVKNFGIMVRFHQESRSSNVFMVMKQV